MKFCEFPYKEVYLSRDGEVWACPWMHCTIGNLYEEDLGEMWTGAVAQQARESILDGSYAFCRKTSCPHLERDDLPDLTEEEIQKAVTPLAETPQVIRIANDLTCNIACTTCRKELFCPDQEYRAKIDKALKDILPYANKAKMLNMNGGGEFLANPSFVEFLSTLRPEHDDYVINFETNGILFDEAHWKRFSHLGRHNVNVVVTVNSLRRETYRYLTGGFDQLEQTKENLRFLSRLRRENQIKWLEVTMVVQECNFQEIPEYVRILAHSEEYFVDRITLRPVYNWFHMEPETYWFKNILNPLHPYHKEYLKILADDCWKDPKVYDWGCHNIRHTAPHPLSQEKTYNRLLMEIFQNSQGLTPAEFLRACMDRVGGKRVGYYGKNDFSKAMAKMLLDAGIDLAFQITWSKEDCDGPVPKVAKQEFRPDMADVMLIIDFHKGYYWFEDLPALGFQGPILSIESFIEGGKV